MYTSFSAANPALTPSELIARGVPGRYYQLTGTVVAHSVSRSGETLHFSVRDTVSETAAAAGEVAAPAGKTAVPIDYSGEVPNPFKEGREVIINVEKRGGSYVAERNSLITKCPSKYKTAPPKANPY